MTVTIGSTTWTFEALGYRPTMTCDDEDLSARLAALLSHLAGAHRTARRTDDITVARQPDGTYRIGSTTSGDVDVPGAAAAVDHLQWHLNSQVVDVVHTHSTGLHAAAAATGGATVLLPAVSGAGKSTLVAALVRDGWSYLTDEAVEVDDDLTAHGYPKAITIDPGAQPLFPELRPQWDDTASWYVSPDDFASGWSATPLPISHVVFPQYSPDRPVDVRRLGPAATVVALAQCTFYFNSDGERHLPLLARLARTVPAFEIEYPDLESALTLVRDILREVPPAAGGVR